MHSEEEIMTEVAPDAKPPQVIHVKTEGNSRSALWILLSVSLGFLLPVCSCGLLILVSIFGLGTLGSSSPVISTGTGDAVAIVRVEGVITSDDNPDVSTGAVSGTVINDLKTAAADDSVKAIILRVDSPGGTVTGAAQIHEALLEIDKPIVVSMVGVAASGGYYVSAPADYIFARPDTVTGSLGVILTLYDATELIEEIGVDVIYITSGPNKAIGSPWEELTPEQEDIFETHIDEAYNDFVQIIADGRNLSVEEVIALADGRTYSGRQAVENGLVDELGNFQDAIDKAADLGGISGEPRIVEYQHLPTLDDFLLGVNGRLHKSDADYILETLDTFMTPSLEYRYVGPDSQ